MQPISRTVAVLLLVTIAAALPGVQASALSAAQPAHPGCHGHAPATPTPAPTSYQCCVSGHHQAMASTPFSLRPLVALFDLDAREGILKCASLSSYFVGSAIPCTSPPNSAPLRV